MKAVILKTKPGSVFHFGEYTPFAETFLDYTSAFPHSDTIFSAIVNIYDQVWPEDTVNFINSFSRGEISLSSGMFYFKGKHKSIFFLPRPVLFLISNQDDWKKYKNVEWISTGVWEHGINENTVIVSKKFVCLKEEWDTLTSDNPESFRAYEIRTSPHVKVHSPVKEDSYYMQSDITILGNNDVEVGYYFMIDISGINDMEEKRLKTVVNLLSDTGLGGQRTCGCGLFENIKWIDNPLPAPDSDDDKYYVNLSLVSPEDEIDKIIAYRVVIRGGRYSGEGYLKKVMMLHEGAVFNKKIAGRIVDISPEGNNKILRYGIGFFHPVKKKLINL